MDTGRILVAEQNGSHVIKFVGDVRMTLSTTIESCLHSMFDRGEFHSVVVDLSETEGIDSTSLGLLAKISREAQARTQQVPVLVSCNEDITKVIVSMGFEHRVFEIISGIDCSKHNLQEVQMQPMTEDQARDKVLEAHKLLMELNEKNRETFKDLVGSIENSH